MSKLYSSRQIVSALERMGFKYTSQKGSHAKFKNTLGKTVVVPMEKKKYRLVLLGVF